MRTLDSIQLAAVSGGAWGGGYSGGIPLLSANSAPAPDDDCDMPFGFIFCSELTDVATGGAAAGSAVGWVFAVHEGVAVGLAADYIAVGAFAGTITALGVVSAGVVGWQIGSAMYNYVNSGYGQPVPPSLPPMP